MADRDPNPFLAPRTDDVPTGGNPDADPTIEIDPRRVTMDLAADEPDTAQVRTGRRPRVTSRRPATTGKQATTRVGDVVAARPARPGRPEGTFRTEDERTAARPADAGAGAWWTGDATVVDPDEGASDRSNEARPGAYGEQASRGHVADDQHTVDEDEDTLVDLDRDQVLAARHRGAARPARRRVRWLRWTLAILLVLAMLAAIGAVLGEGYARRRATTLIQDSLSQAFHTDARASVEDRSVLWSLGRGRLDRVTFVADDASVDTENGPVTFLQIKGSGAGITHPTDPERTVIRQIEGDARISWAELSRLAGVEITPAGAGRVEVQQTVAVFGANVNVRITARPELDPATRKVTLQDAQAKAARLPVPAVLLRSALRRVDDRLYLPELPGLGYTSMVVGNEGASVHVSGRDVPLSEFRR